MQVNVRHDLRRVSIALAAYPREALASGVRAMNRAVVSARQDAVNRLRKEYPSLLVRSIRGQMKLKNASARDPEAWIDFSPKRFRLFGNFATRQTKKGVPLRAIPWRIETLDGEPVPKTALRNAFIQRSTRTGVRNVWVREGKQRYPITALLASSLATAMVERGISQAVVTVGQQRFAVEFERDLQYRISLRKGAP